MKIKYAFYFLILSFILIGGFILYSNLWYLSSKEISEISIEKFTKGCNSDDDCVLSYGLGCCSGQVSINKNKINEFNDLKKRTKNRFLGDCRAVDCFYDPTVFKSVCKEDECVAAPIESSQECFSKYICPINNIKTCGFYKNVCVYESAKSSSDCNFINVSAEGGQDYMEACSGKFK